MRPDREAALREIMKRVPSAPTRKSWSEGMALKGRGATGCLEVGEAVRDCRGIWHE
mgnify:CR=1 FL=1